MEQAGSLCKATEKHSAAGFSLVLKILNGHLRTNASVNILPWRLKDGRKGCGRTERDLCSGSSEDAASYHGAFNTESLNGNAKYYSRNTWGIRAAGPI